MTTRAATGLAGFLEWVRANLTATEVVNVDETGWRVADRPRWVHSASTGKHSLIFGHDRRGTKGMHAAHHGATRRGGDPDPGEQADGQTARPGPAPDRPPGRLPAVHCRPTSPVRQRRGGRTPEGSSRGRRSPDSCGPSLEPSAATSPPPPNTASTSSQPPTHSPRAVPDCPKPPETASLDLEDLTSYPSMTMEPAVSITSAEGSITSAEGGHCTRMRGVSGRSEARMPIEEVAVEPHWGPAKFSGTSEPDVAERDASQERSVELSIRVVVAPLQPGHGILGEALTSMSWMLNAAPQPVLVCWHPELERWGAHCPESHSVVDHEAAQNLRKELEELRQRTEVLPVAGECQPWLMRRTKCLHR